MDQPEQNEKSKPGLSLQEIWDTYDQYTGKASEISRQLCFAGIAIVWLFRNSTDHLHGKPKGLVFSLLLFTLALAVDLLQYVRASILWNNYGNRIQTDQRRRFNGKIDLAEVSEPDDSISNEINRWFWIKIGLTAIGYGWLAWCLFDYLFS